MYSFEWKLSYRDQVGYRVFGLPGASYGIEAIEEYRKLSDRDYLFDRETYNGTQEEFERNIVARGGGVALRIKPYRLQQDVYEAFVAWRKKTHAENCAYIAAHPEKYGDYQPDPLIIPRPIYWSHEAKTWVNEPWYQEAANAA